MRIASVIELQREGILLVEDGNHGDSRPRANEFVDAGTAFIRAADMGDGAVLFDQASKIDAAATARITKGIGRPGDVLLSHKGTVGKVAAAPLDAPPFVCSPQTTLWRTMNLEVLDREYLFAFLRSRFFHDQLAAFGGETDMAPYVSLTSQRAIKVVVPEIQTQRAIGQTLSAIDAKIELNRRMNETLEAMAQAIFRDWFVDFGPVRRKLAGATEPAEIMGGLTPDPARAAELAGLFPDAIGEDGLPLGWSERPIGDLVDIAGGSTPSTADESFWHPAEHRWATPKDLSNMSDLALFDTGRRISSAGLSRITSGLLPAGTVLLSSRAPIGYLAIAQAPVAINQGFIALKPTEDFGGAYLYLWCKVNMEAILANANGSTFQEISKKNFRPITSAIPDDGSACRAFGEIADPMFARIVSAAAENRTLGETRDYLLPRLMSGEVCVTNTDQQDPAA